MFSDEFEALGGALRLPVDPEVMEAEEPAQQDPSFLITGNDNGGRRRRARVDHSH